MGETKVTNAEDKVDDVTKEKIKSLLIKGFNNAEISQMTGINEEAIKGLGILKEDTANITKSSIEFYNELQKDLSKLTLTEMGKANRDSGIILNSIKLQAELQEKKIGLNQYGQMGTTINRDYIRKRDEELAEAVRQGKSIEGVADEFLVSVAQVRMSVDRVELNLPDELTGIAPSIITETMGLDREMRLKILQEVKEKKMTRQAVREMCNKIKNETRLTNG